MRERGRKVNHTARRIWRRERCEAAEQEIYLTFKCMNTVGLWVAEVWWG